jgi:hypothetical protein
MEKRNVRRRERQKISEPVAVEQFVPEVSLSAAEVHTLVEFFQTLDRWDRELVHNGSKCKGVTVCRVQ